MTRRVNKTICDETEDITNYCKHIQRVVSIKPTLKILNPLKISDTCRGKFRINQRNFDILEENKKMLIRMNWGKNRELKKIWGKPLKLPLSTRIKNKNLWENFEKNVTLLKKLLYVKPSYSVKECRKSYKEHCRIVADLSHYKSII